MSTKATRINWKELHKELEGRISRLGSSIDSNDERVQELLRKRTEQLAAAPANRIDAGSTLRAIVLRLGSERYALPVECAREVTHLSRTAILPESGDAVIGVINWRGEFVTVFDLALMLGVTAANEETDKRRVVVLRGEEPYLALVVDGVEHVVEIDVSKLHSTDELRVERGDFLKGATADGLVALDAPRLLASLREDLQAA